MLRRFDKYTEIVRTISTFCCRPCERSRCLDDRRRFRDRWGKMFDSRKNKTSSNRLRIWTPSFFGFQVIPNRRFSSKHDDSTTQFLSRCLLHALDHQFQTFFETNCKRGHTSSDFTSFSVCLFDQTKTHVQNLYEKIMCDLDCVVPVMTPTPAVFDDCSLRLLSCVELLRLLFTLCSWSNFTISFL